MLWPLAGRTQERARRIGVSMPITLDEANRAGRLKKGDVIAMMAIGAGMTWGGAVLRW